MAHSLWSPATDPLVEVCDGNYCQEQSQPSRIRGRWSGRQSEEHQTPPIVLDMGLPTPHLNLKIQLINTLVKKKKWMI
ncbi:MAG: hypothetical protein COT88_01560 [Candidatus Colwellbacteria bacterium CG10_big_fil_rev_8_21_14_0_10_41_28]|uniref:Uncharacterized protein n=1 Tax=Candidatus Colwellbacteria bacterium CG10_big_fil_rev_8_21_14_0_10_41_28 TaxID=1974539 RepID=A0A2H0VHD6_9BACT|nr:MAG: hypothetical protein COT88_01560 [Candidatus Colwellbacteria bacterium CG10_big_fil_rev_8_21_14_0_10_41_28]